MEFGLTDTEDEHTGDAAHSPTSSQFEHYSTVPVC